MRIARAPSRWWIAGIALAAALVAGCNQPPPAPEDIGAKIKRECESLVDLAHRNEDGNPVVRVDKLEVELKQRGIATPVYRVSTDPKAAKKKYDEEWEALRSHPGYGDAFRAVLYAARKTAVHDCVMERVRKEGVR